MLRQNGRTERQREREEREKQRKDGAKSWQFPEMPQLIIICWLRASGGMLHALSVRVALT